MVAKNNEKRLRGGGGLKKYDGPEEQLASSLVWGWQKKPLKETQHPVGEKRHQVNSLDELRERI